MTTNQIKIKAIEIVECNSRYFTLIVKTYGGNGIDRLSMGGPLMNGVQINCFKGVMENIGELTQGIQRFYFEGDYVLNAFGKNGTQDCMKISRSEIRGFPIQASYEQVQCFNTSKSHNQEGIGLRNLLQIAVEKQNQSYNSNLNLAEDFRWAS
jgi:hypothetical protein